MDALTSMLRSVRMESSVFSRANLSAPFGVESGHMPRGIFHAVVRGRAWVGLAAGGEPVELGPGDIAFMPFGDNHLVTDEPGRPVRYIGDLTTVDENGMGHLLVDGDGPQTSLVCGSVTFSGGEAHPVFSLLPPVVRVRDTEGRAARLIEDLIRLIADEVDVYQPGSETVVARLADVLVIYMLRSHIQSLPDDAAGWLAALRDPVLADALGLIHGHPENGWTATELASRVGLSRSAFFARFREKVGEPPAEYITRWRLHAAAGLLRDEGLSVATAGRRVGYRTEAAFSNAFLRVMGIRPGAYKRAARGAELRSPAGG